MTGIETFASNLLAFLSKKEDITPIALFASNSNFERVENGIKEISVKTIMIFGGLYPVATFRFLFTAYNIFRKTKNKVVVINGRHFTTSYIAFVLCKLMRIPYIYVDSGFQPNIFSSSLVNLIMAIADKLFFGNIAYSAKEVIAISEYTKSILIKLHPGLKDRIFIINTGFNDDKVLPYYGVQKEQIVTFASRISSIKDPITVAKAYEILSKKYSDWKFYLIGKGDFEINPSNYSFSENVIIQNELLPQPKLLEFLSKSSIYINSSLSEGFSLANQEALALGNVGVFSKASSNIEMAKLVGLEEYNFEIQNAEDLVNKVSSAIETIKETNFQLNTEVAEKAKAKLAVSVIFEKYYKLIQDLRK